MRFQYDPIGELWHGMKWRCGGYPWYNLGVVAFDFYPLPRKIAVYFWRFSVTFQLWESKS